MQKSPALIIADDLTGANDTGVQFARFGWPTYVQLQTTKPVGGSPKAGSVTVVNAETRSLYADEAKRRTEKLIYEIGLQSFEHVFKKVDSTMRGNIGAELEAMMTAGMFDMAVIAPAYPLKGRTTVGGYHLLQGALLEDSEIAKDPKHPVKHSKLTEIIGSQTELPIAHLDLSFIRRGGMAEAIAEQRRSGVRLFTFDTVCDQDLDKVCQTVSGLGQNVLWTGSAGLGGVLARLWHEGSTNKEGGAFSLSITVPGTHVLLIAGSMSSVTARQIEMIKHKGIEIMKLDPLPLLLQGELFACSLEGQRLLKEAEALLMRNSSLAVVLDNSEEKRVETKQRSNEEGLSLTEAGNRIADALGKWSSVLVQSVQPRGLVLTGGDTAYGVCRRLGIETLEIVGEVEEGLPVCLTSTEQPLAIVTKAGAFGNHESLLNAVKKLGNFLK